jgi:hypothetical protein
LHLKSDGFPCSLVHRLPSEGIVVAYRDFLPDEVRPGPELLLVCILADKEEPGAAGPHPYAQIHVVQNPKDRRVLKRGGLWPAYYVPYWPQPGLQPREPERGDRFDTAAFFGYASNVAPELRGLSWAKRLHALGLTWRLVPRQRWHDYSDVDVVVAVRSFDHQEYLYKPPSKLHNAWRAGVPAILGRESAYSANRTSELDYLEVTSVEEAVAALTRLRDDPALRHAMVENGRRRGEEVDPRTIVERWRRMLTHGVRAEHARWCVAPRWRRAVFMRRRAWARRAWAVAGR